MPRILIVCTGNICRSPAAEVLLRHRLEQAGLSDWEVESAGTWAAEDRSASREMVQLMAQRDLDLTPHRSRMVTRRMMQEADLVLVMTHSHAEALRLEFSDQADKIYLFSEIKQGRRYDIKDPYGRTWQEYRECVRELDELVDAGLDKIVSLVEQSEH